jgi:hypothetical protein
MALSRQQKLIIISLVCYWPTLFVLTHIPIPNIIREADFSDKVLHFLAYLILTFLLWSAANPNRKVSWRPHIFLSKTRAGFWWVLLVIALYGVGDELLQNFVAGRCCDFRDFILNMVGALTGLIVLSIFTFWPACLVVTGITIFGLTNISRVDIASLLPVLDKVFHIIAYAFFTLVWIQYIHQKFKILKPSKPKWLVVALSLPIGFLLAVKLGSLILGGIFTIKEVTISAIGIAVVVGTFFTITLLRRNFSKAAKPLYSDY